MSSHQSDIVVGGWWQSFAGIAVSARQWLVGDANGMTIILTLLTIILTAAKVFDLVRRWRSTADGPLMQRIREATRPAELDS